MIILEENFKWHLEAFASELFIYIYKYKSNATLSFNCCQGNTQCVFCQTRPIEQRGGLSKAHYHLKKHALKWRAENRAVFDQVE